GAGTRKRRGARQRERLAEHDRARTARLAPRRAQPRSTAAIVGCEADEERGGRQRDRLIRTGVRRWRRIHGAEERRTGDPRPARAEQRAVLRVARRIGCLPAALVEAPASQQST